MKKEVKKRLERIVANAGKRAAIVEANTACSFFSYQPKEPKTLKNLRNF